LAVTAPLAVLVMPGGRTVTLGRVAGGEVTQVALGSERDTYGKILVVG
jgi:hypothetical protein